MTAQIGDVRIARTNTFGYYRFEGVGAGATYIFNVYSKCCSYATQVVSIDQSLTGLNFEAF